MDFIVKFLFYSGKYLIEVTTQSLIEACKRSIIVHRNIMRRYDDKFKVLGNHDNMLELFNENIEVMGNDPEMQLVFISDRHKVEFENYLKNIENSLLLMEDNITEDLLNKEFNLLNLDSVLNSYNAIINNKTIKNINVTRLGDEEISATRRHSFVCTHVNLDEQYGKSTNLISNDIIPRNTFKSEHDNDYQLDNIDSGEHLQIMSLPDITKNIRVDNNETINKIKQEEKNVCNTEDGENTSSSNLIMDSSKNINYFMQEHNFNYYKNLEMKLLAVQKDSSNTLELKSVISLTDITEVPIKSKGEEKVLQVKRSNSSKSLNTNNESKLDIEHSSRLLNQNNDYFKAFERRLHDMRMKRKQKEVKTDRIREMHNISKNAEFFNHAEQRLQSQIMREEIVRLTGDVDKAMKYISSTEKRLRTIEDRLQMELGGETKFKAIEDSLKIEDNTEKRLKSIENNFKIDEEKTVEGTIRDKSKVKPITKELKQKNIQMSKNNAQEETEKPTKPKPGKKFVLKIVESDKKNVNDEVVPIKFQTRESAKVESVVQDESDKTNVNDDEVIPLKFPTRKSAKVERVVQDKANEVTPLKLQLKKYQYVEPKPAINTPKASAKSSNIKQKTRSTKIPSLVNINHVKPDNNDKKVVKSKSLTKISDKTYFYNLDSVRLTKHKNTTTDGDYKKSILNKPFKPYPKSTNTLIYEGVINNDKSNQVVENKPKEKEFVPNEQDNVGVLLDSIKSTIQIHKTRVEKAMDNYDSLVFDNDLSKTNKEESWELEYSDMFPNVKSTHCIDTKGFDEFEKQLSSIYDKKTNKIIVNKEEFKLMADNFLEAQKRNCEFFKRFETVTSETEKKYPRRDMGVVAKEAISAAALDGDLKDMNYNEFLRQYKTLFLDLEKQIDRVKESVQMKPSPDEDDTERKPTLLNIDHSTGYSKKLLNNSIDDLNIEPLNENSGDSKKLLNTVDRLNNETLNEKTKSATSGKSKTEFKDVTHQEEKSSPLELCQFSSQIEKLTNEMLKNKDLINKGKLFVQNVFFDEAFTQRLSTHRKEREDIKNMIETNKRAFAELESDLKTVKFIGRYTKVEERGKDILSEQLRSSLKKANDGNKVEEIKRRNVKVQEKRRDLLSEQLKASLSKVIDGSSLKERKIEVRNKDLLSEQLKASLGKVIDGSSLKERKIEVRNKDLLSGQLRANLITVNNEGTKQVTTNVEEQSKDLLFEQLKRNVVKANDDIQANDNIKSGENNNKGNIKNVEEIMTKANEDNKSEEIKAVSTKVVDLLSEQLKSNMIKANEDNKSEEIKTLSAKVQEKRKDLLSEQLKIKANENNKSDLIKATSTKVEEKSKDLLSEQLKSNMIKTNENYQSEETKAKKVEEKSKDLLSEQLKCNMAKANDVAKLEEISAQVKQHGQSKDILSEQLKCNFIKTNDDKNVKHTKLSPKNVETSKDMLLSEQLITTSLIKENDANNSKETKQEIPIKVEAQSRLTEPLKTDLIKENKGIKSEETKQTLINVEQQNKYILSEEVKDNLKEPKDEKTSKEPKQESTHEEEQSNDKLSEELKANLMIINDSKHSEEAKQMSNTEKKKECKDILSEELKDNLIISNDNTKSLEIKQVNTIQEKTNEMLSEKLIANLIKANAVNKLEITKLEALKSIINDVPITKRDVGPNKPTIIIQETMKLDKISNVANDNKSTDNVKSIFHDSSIINSRPKMNISFIKPGEKLKQYSFPNDETEYDMSKYRWENVKLKLVKSDPTKCTVTNQLQKDKSVHKNLNKQDIKKKEFHTNCDNRAWNTNVNDDVYISKAIDLSTFSSNLLLNNFNLDGKVPKVKVEKEFENRKIEEFQLNSIDVGSLVNEWDNNNQEIKCDGDEEFSFAQNDDSLLKLITRQAKFVNINNDTVKYGSDKVSNVFKQNLKDFVVQTSCASRCNELLKDEKNEQNKNFASSNNYSGISKKQWGTNVKNTDVFKNKDLSAVKNFISKGNPTIKLNKKMESTNLLQGEHPTDVSCKNIEEKKEINDSSCVKPCIKTFARKCYRTNEMKTATVGSVDNLRKKCNQMRLNVYSKDSSTLKSQKIFDQIHTNIRKLSEANKDKFKAYRRVVKLKKDNIQSEIEDPESTTETSERLLRNSEHLFNESPRSLTIKSQVSVLPRSTLWNQHTKKVNQALKNVHIESIKNKQKSKAYKIGNIYKADQERNNQEKKEPPQQKKYKYEVKPVTIGDRKINITYLVEDV